MELKKANVTPIYKGGDSRLAANYRPISLTSIPCKIMESIKKEKNIDHLVGQNQISQNQHGFFYQKSLLPPICLYFMTWSPGPWKRGSTLTWFI